MVESSLVYGTVRPSLVSAGKVAVLVCMDDYVDLDDDYRPNKKEISEYNPDFKQHR